MVSVSLQIAIVLVLVLCMFIFRVFQNPSDEKMEHSSFRSHEKIVLESSLVRYIFFGLFLRVDLVSTFITVSWKKISDRSQGYVLFASRKQNIESILIPKQVIMLLITCEYIVSIQTVCLYCYSFITHINVRSCGILTTCIW